MTGRPQLFSQRCATCVFHSGNRMSLAPGRLAGLIAENRATGSLLICHLTTYGQRPEGEVMCRGYFDAYADTSRVVHIMAALTGRPDWYEIVDPPEEHTP
jgi:hypothetical protein